MKIEQLLTVVVAAIAKKTATPAIVDFDNYLTLQVDAEDQGRFVGKNGSHIWAIQSLFWYAGLAQFGYPYTVKLIDPKVKCTYPPAPFRFRPDWDREVINNLCDTIIKTCVPGHASFYLREEAETRAVVQIKIMKYLQRNMEDPSFTEALSIVLRVAGMSQGCNVRTEYSWS